MRAPCVIVISPSGSPLGLAPQVRSLYSLEPARLLVICPMKSNAINRLAKQFGYNLRRQSKHLIWKHQITGAVVTTAKTPSDWRALRNIEKHFANGTLV